MNQTPRQAKAMFEALALPCLNDLGRFALSLTRNQMEAEDLVQSTYCRALEKFQTFDGRNIRSWLSSILYSLFINSCRRKKLEGHAMVSRDFSQGQGDGNVRDPLDTLEVIEMIGERENQAVSKLACDDIQRAIDALPSEFREVIVLREQNDLSYKEIASVLGCPAGTVMSRLNRGRKLLQEMLRDQAEELGIPVPPKKTTLPHETSSELDVRHETTSQLASDKGAASSSTVSNDHLCAPMDLNAYRRRRRGLG